MVRKQKRILFLGLLFLTIGSTLLRFLPRAALLPESANDATTGLFYGLAIGCLVLALRTKRISCSESQ